MTLACIMCRKGPAQGVTLHRINAKGQLGVWACARHLKHTDAPPLDADFVELIHTIERRGPPA